MLILNKLNTILTPIKRWTGSSQTKICKERLSVPLNLTYPSNISQLTSYQLRMNRAVVATAYEETNSNIFHMLIDDIVYLPLPSNRIEHRLKWRSEEEWNQIERCRNKHNLDNDNFAQETRRKGKFRGFLNKALLDKLSFCEELGKTCLRVYTLFRLMTRYHLSRPAPQNGYVYVDTQQDGDL